LFPPDHKPPIDGSEDVPFQYTTLNGRFCVVTMGGWFANNYRETLAPGAVGPLEWAFSSTSLKFKDRPEATIPAMIAAGDAPTAVLIVGDWMSDPVCTINVPYLNLGKPLLVGFMTGDCAALTS